MRNAKPAFFARISGRARCFVGDCRAASSIEYALIASGIAVAIAGVVVGVGSEVRDNWYQKLYDAYPS
jgi:Flp pilus assembly pilin Flp